VWLYFYAKYDKIEAIEEAILAQLLFYKYSENLLACGLYFVIFCDNIEATGN
jgi:hypothetical protein